MSGASGMSKNGMDSRGEPTGHGVDTGSNMSRQVGKANLYGIPMSNMGTTSYRVSYVSHDQKKHEMQEWEAGRGRQHSAVPTGGSHPEQYRAIGGAIYEKGSSGEWSGEAAQGMKNIVGAYGGNKALKEVDTGENSGRLRAASKKM